MTVARNLVVSLGLVAVWLVAIFFLFMSPTFQAFTVSFNQSHLSGVDQRLGSFLWIAVPYALGGLIVGFLTAVLVLSPRPLVWAVFGGLAMSVVLLLNTVDSWFLSQSVFYQGLELLLTLLPLGFCAVGAVIASRFRRAAAA